MFFTIAMGWYKDKLNNMFTKQFIFIALLIFHWVTRENNLASIRPTNSIWFTSAYTMHDKTFDDF